jgi:hypothetical protein
MRTTASQIRPADLVRGIGLTVEFAEPENDFATRLVGTVSTRDSETGGYEQYAAQIVLPNEHRVNVRRAFQPGDRVTVPSYYFTGTGLEDMDAIEALLEPVGPVYLEAEVDEVRADERQVVVFVRPEDEADLLDAPRVAVPFRSTRHAV